jgi:hypothetical protein
MSAAQSPRISSSTPLVAPRRRGILRILIRLAIPLVYPACVRA